MSLINKMLQELDRREAPVGDDRTPKQVRPVAPRASQHEWFWRALAALILVALAWMGWVAYQLWPRPLATEGAFKAAGESRSRAVPPVAMSSPTPAPVAPPAATAAAPAPLVEPAAPAQPEALRLAQSIETPIPEPKPALVQPSPPPTTVPKPEPVKPRVTAKPAPVPAGLTRLVEKPKVERREHIGTPAERAENEFRYGVGALKAGRSTEAEQRFGKALEFDSGHRGARQALVATHIERGQLEPARKLLQEGLALDPAQPDFAIALARILVERKDFNGALAVLDRSAASAADIADFHALRGTVLRGLGRHAEAAQAYQTAVQTRSTLPKALVGLGISLEALNRRPEAAEAFRRALVAGPVSDDVRTFAEQRIRALR
jgi:MSHA biogenesis protein MshN